MQWPEWAYRAGILQHRAGASAVTPEKSPMFYHGKLSPSATKFRMSEYRSSSSGFESRQLSAKSSPAPKEKSSPIPQGEDLRKLGSVEDIIRSNSIDAFICVLLCFSNAYLGIEYELSQAPLNISDSRRSIAGWCCLSDLVSSVLNNC